MSDYRPGHVYTGGLCKDSVELDTFHRVQQAVMDGRPITAEEARVVLEALDRMSMIVYETRNISRALKTLRGLL